MKVIVLTQTIKEHISVYSGTELLELENNNYSPIRAIAHFEQK